MLFTEKGADLILERLEVGPFGTNCYLVACPDTKEAVVIDPGAEGDMIIKRCQDKGLKVKCIINTHGHIDHVGANEDVKSYFKVPVFVHEVDLPLYRSPKSGMALLMGNKEVKPPDDTFKEGDVFRYSSLNIRIMETPGHTPGGVTLDINGTLFPGDTLFAGSIGRTDMPGGSYRQIIESIKKRMLPYADETRVFPGHGPPTTVGEERKYNPFLTQT